MEEEVKPSRKLNEKITALQEDIEKIVSRTNCAVLDDIVVLAFFKMSSGNSCGTELPIASTVATVITKHHKGLCARVCFPQRQQGEAEVSCTEERLSSRRSALAALCENNTVCQVSAEEHRAKLSHRYRGSNSGSHTIAPSALTVHRAALPFCLLPPPSEAAVRQMREETKHMLGEITHNDERAEKATQEMTRVGARHRATVAKLREQEVLTSAQEHRAGVSDGTCPCPYELLPLLLLLLVSLGSFSVPAARQAQLERLRKDLRSQTEALELLKVRAQVSARQIQARKCASAA